MEYILCVLTGGILVAGGYFLARLDQKVKPEKKPEPDSAYMTEEKPVKPETPKSGVPMEVQIDEMMGYDPHKALRRGERNE